MRSWQNKSGQWILSIKISDFSGASNGNYDEEVVIANDFFLNNIIDHQEELEVDGSGGGGGITPLVDEM